MKVRMLTGAVVAGSLLLSTAPALARAKSTHKPVTLTYTASAYPDPTSTDPVSGDVCVSKLPTAKFSKAFTVPAAGTLTVSLANQFDWSLAIRDTDGSVEGSSDGGMPTDHEQASVPFKKGQKVSIDTCNFAGEPSVVVSVRFTYR